MDPFTLNLIVSGSITAVNTGIAIIAGKNQLKRQEKQQEYEETIRKKDYITQAKHHEQLLRLKRELSQEQFEADFALRQKQHYEQIEHTAYMAALNDWPIDVPPMVMRNDSLQVPEMSIYDLICQQEPVHLILGSCRNNRYKEIQEQLLLKVEAFVNAYCNDIRGHNILFYRNSWKPMFETADSVVIANIHEKVSTIPFIFLDPEVKDGNFFIRLSHWNILQEGHYENRVTIPFKVEIDNPEATSGIVALINSTVVRLVDAYAWWRYKQPPIFPFAIRESSFEYGKESVDKIVEDYTTQLLAHLEQGFLFPTTDSAEIFSYCNQVDSIADGTPCLHALLAYIAKSDMKKDADSLDTCLKMLPYRGPEFSHSLLEHLSTNKIDISEEAKHHLCKQHVLNQLAERTYSEIENSKKVPFFEESILAQTESYKNAVKIIKEKGKTFLNSCERERGKILHHSIVQANKGLSITNWVEAIMTKMLHEQYSFVFDSCKTICREELLLLKMKRGCIAVYLDYLYLAIEDKFYNYPQEAVKDAINTFKAELHNKYANTHPDWCVDGHYKRDLDGKINRYAAWVKNNYTISHWTSNDEVFTDDDLYNAGKNSLPPQNETYLRAIWDITTKTLTECIVKQ